MSYFSWDDLGEWNVQAMQSLYSLLESRRQTLEDIEDDVQFALRRFDSKGAAADALRAAIQPVIASMSSVERSLNKVKSATTSAEVGVLQVQIGHPVCSTAASAALLEIEQSGHVKVQSWYETLYEQMIASPFPPLQTQGASMKLAAETARDALQTAVDKLFETAENADNDFESAITAAANEAITTETAASGSPSGDAPKNNMTPSQLKELGGIDNPDLAEADAGDMFMPPRVDQEKVFPEEMGVRQTFPPDDAKLEPNTHYEVHQKPGYGHEGMVRGYYYTDEHGNITHIDGNANTTNDGALNYDLRQPKPDTTYRVNNATFFTDDQSRTEHTVIDNIDFTVPSSDTSDSVHANVTSGTTPNNHNLNFDAGHQQARSAGGIREEINYTAQNREVNQNRPSNPNNFYRIEDEWRAQSKRKDVDAIITNTYDSDVQNQAGVPSKVPSSYEIDYTVDQQNKPSIHLNNLK